MVEFITVKFPSTRDVFIDGEKCGSTNKRLQVQTGRHTIDLGDPRNYEPSFRRPLVQGTNVIRPMEVVFDQI